MLLITLNISSSLIILTRFAKDSLLHISFSLFFFYFCFLLFAFFFCFLFLYVVFIPLHAYVVVILLIRILQFYAKLLPYIFFCALNVFFLHHSHHSVCVCVKNSVCSFFPHFFSFLFACFIIIISFSIFFVLVFLYCWLHLTAFPTFHCFLIAILPSHSKAVFPSFLCLFRSLVHFRLRKEKETKKPKEKFFVSFSIIFLLHLFHNFSFFFTWAIIKMLKMQFISCPFYRVIFLFFFSFCVFFLLLNCPCLQPHWLGNDERKKWNKIISIQFCCTAISYFTDFHK